jgi:mannosyltransferase OCH1-like enzyme
MDTKIPWINNSMRLIKSCPPVTIPLKFHMIWVGDKDIPEYAIVNFLNWKKMMPHWEERLWTNKDINLNEFSQEVIDKINQAKYGAQKADIMRYYILEKYGGFYIDMDTTALRPLDPLVYIGDELILYHDNDLTWEYIINNFIGTIPHHPVLKEACRMVINTELNTEDVHMKTGPFLWGHAVSQVPPESGKKYTLLDSTFFSKFIEYDQKFGIHQYARSWLK